MTPPTHDETAGTEPDERDVESPTDLTPRSRKYVLKATLREFSDDQCTDLAAALTYYAVLALFPAVIALASLLGLVGQGTTAVQTVLDMLKDLGAGSMVQTIEKPLLDLSRTPGAGLALVLGLAGALWSASGYVGAFARAMNRIYEIREGRPVWKLRPQMLLLTLVLVVLAALVLLALVVTGPVVDTVGAQLHIGSVGRLAWEIAKWPVLLGVVILMVALLYYATPNVRLPKFRWISVGAAVAIITWIILSVLFGLYVANFSSYDKTYGTLGGVIAFLLWLWLTNLALLFGAELDAELERGRELQAGEPAEESVQLPPRDDRNIRKAEKKEQQSVEEAREIREDAGRE